MIRQLKFLGGLLLAAGLAACGGGGGSPGATPGTDPSTPVVASFVYQLSKTTINNSGGDTAELTVTALDASNNPVSGATVAVAVDSGVYTPDSTTTDASGQAKGAISVGSNKANRNIKATITVGGKTSTAEITVTGAAITLTPVPATATPGGAVRMDIKVADSSGVGVPSVAVALGGTLGLSGTVTTDNSGVATANLAAAPGAAGSYTVTASGLNVQVSRTVQVVSGTDSGIPVAVGTISSASISIVPNNVAPNAAGATTNRSNLRALFLNPSNQAIQNVRVRFEIVPPGLGSGEQISTGSATVYSDVSGEAIADYIPGTRSSPTDGVTIRACYGANDASIANGACPNSVTKTLTVAARPLSITLGDNNLLAKGNNDLTYIKQFDIAVADAAGNAVANAAISASVDIGYYGKGTFAGLYPGQTLADSFSPANASTPIDNSVDPGTERVWCLNEDTNRNGAVDSGEDINGNRTLEPRKADVILSFVGSNVTNAAGRMTIQVEYPQNVATWLTYTVRATTSVAGSEGLVSKSYITTYVDGDDANGSFLIAPYGSHACNAPN
jgi:hypothetical protein